MSLEHTLSGLLHGRISASGTDMIIHAAMGHARSYIRWLVWHRNYSLIPLGLSADDVACDAIAELLSEIDGENMERLRRALTSVASGDDAGISLECAFKAIVLRTVRLNLARVFMEMHPTRARLLRSLRRFVQSSDRFVRYDGIAGYWYAFSDGDARLQFPSAPQDALRAMLVPPEIRVQPAAAVLEALLEALRVFPTLRQAVSEEDVLDLTLQILQADQLPTSPETSASEDGMDSDSLALEALVALESLRPWVDTAYVTRGKLTGAEAEAMLMAAEHYIRDLAAAQERGHFHYLRTLLPELTHADYRARYRNIYEYFLRTVFTRTRERLQLFSEDQEGSVGRRDFKTQ